MNIICSVGLPEEILNESNRIVININCEEDCLVIPVFDNKRSKDDFER